MGERQELNMFLLQVVERVSIVAPVNTYLIHAHTLTPSHPTTPLTHTHTYYCIFQTYFACN